MNLYTQAQLDRSTIISERSLKQICPTCKDPEEWAKVIGPMLYDAGFTRAHPVALFMAQIGHESMDLNRREESLYYSAHRLMQVWPSRFPTLEDAKPYAGNPRALANKTYGGRLGNNLGDDGWDYRGRGLIQLTGKANYAECTKGTGLPLLQDPDLLQRDYEAALESAIWYWKTYVSADSIRATTRQINGGYHGLEDRMERYERAMDVLDWVRS